MSEYTVPMKVLVIEDDSRVAQYLDESLSSLGFTVDRCTSLDEVRSYFLTMSECPQLAVLDRMLGRDDGALLIPELKKKLNNLPILVLSSLDMPSEKARLLDAGADEYVSKPFSLEELVARIRLLLRRAKTTPQDDSMIRQVGNLVIDLRTQSTSIGGRKLDLTKKEFQLLCLLSERPGRVFNRFQILDQIWNIERVTESNVVETTIKNIRKKLQENNSTAHIESKRNFGYWIEA